MRSVILDVAFATWWAGWSLLRSRAAPMDLDTVRSDLAHETASKFARLEGFAEEWRQNRYLPGDEGDVAAILEDLRSIHLRHVRLAAAGFGTMAAMLRLLTALQSARSENARQPSVGAPSIERVVRLKRTLGALRRDSQRLVDGISAHHARRVADIVLPVVSEIEREQGRGNGKRLVAVEAASQLGTAWVPGADVASWSDVLRNVLRNALQAVTEAHGAMPPGAVTVRILRCATRGATAIEILDNGVGMNAEQMATMWSAGHSRHGSARGNGLTEGKRAWLEARARLEVRSAPGAGTCIRFDLSDRNVPIRGRRLWTLPPVILPVAAAVVLATGRLLYSTPPAVTSVDVADATVLRALDAGGQVLWQRDLGETVVPNYLSNIGTGPAERPENDRSLLLEGAWPWGRRVLVATQPPQGAGKVWQLDERGRTQWTRTLGWNEPLTRHTGQLTAVFATPWRWPDGRTVVAINVRDGNYSSTSIQYWNDRGEVLGEYNHPGHLEFRAVADVDGDGIVELLLSGVNNDANSDRSFLSEDPEVYVDCLVMLHAPAVTGQAYPYRRWERVTAAREEGYLLIPPLRRGVRPIVERVNLGTPVAPGTAAIEIVVRDGRIVRTDAFLRPISCGVGDHTLARTLGPTPATGPFLYVHDAVRDLIDLQTEVAQRRP